MAESTLPVEVVAVVESLTIPQLSEVVTLARKLGRSRRDEAKDRVKALKSELRALTPVRILRRRGKGAAVETAPETEEAAA